MALKVVGGSPKYTTKELEKYSQEYSEVSGQIKLLSDTKTNLADKIKEASEILGTKDDKGSFYVTVGKFICGKVAKKSISLNQTSALKFLKEKGLYNDCVEVQKVEVINEKKLADLVSSGVISQSEFEKLCDVKVLYSVSVKEVEEMPEVDTSHALQSAASKKKKALRL